MKHLILGLHHVTATVDDAQADLDFYHHLLGLRLVKKTVNFDNANVYHFYYGNERGAPGTIWTTFPYMGWGVGPGVHGSGQITLTSFSVPPQSLRFWRLRLEEHAIGSTAAPLPSGGETLSFTDPSGLAIRLVEDHMDQRPPWTGNGITGEAAIRGLESIRMTVANPDPTLALLTELLGFEVTERSDPAACSSRSPPSSPGSPWMSRSRSWDGRSSCRPGKSLIEPRSSGACLR